MLKKLKVQNFALIDRTEIEFENTFIVITGETGAGKSVLLNALSIILGGKVDTSTMFDKNKKLIVEGTFDISNIPLKDFFQDNDIDYSEETILRREVSSDGKTRAFINDTPVNISLLKVIGQQLIDIHSQHQNLLINSIHFRYNFIDAIAGIIQERNAYTSLFKQYQKEKRELESLIQQQVSAQKEMDYYQYLVKELQDANIQEGELSQLEEELQQLENAENIIQQLSSAIQALQTAEINAIQLITQAKNNLQSIVSALGRNSKYTELAERLQTNIIDIKDIAHEIDISLNNTEINPERITILTDRIDTINKLLKKHSVKTDAELLQVYSELQTKLSAYENLDDAIEEKRKHLTTIEKQLSEQAEQLSQKRKTAKTKIEGDIKDILKELAMPNAQFIVNISEKSALNDFNEFGKDDVQFLFSANKGIVPAELQKVASGGEISRLMLSIKSMMAKNIALPTIIFDEIDTGTSGPIASKMGDIMKKMSKTMQVIVITHLPQIAAKGKQHLYVSKEEQHNKTISKITQLNENERVIEIAKMLSNDKPGDAALQNAKELLEQN